MILLNANEKPPSFHQHSWRLTLFFFLALFLLAACGASESHPAPATLTYEILETHPHDSNTFTQGLVVHNGVITEVSGLYAKSFVVQYRADNGEVLKRLALPRDIFAEGITLFDGRLYMLTWHNEKAYVFDAQSLSQETILTYTGEGWGITHDGKHLITSDGSDTLSFRQPQDFSVVKRISVHGGSQSWRLLNELEYAQGFIWANVWQTPYMLAIRPTDGSLAGILNLTELERANNHRPGESVLNGIAYDAATDSFWITGKLWPNRYRIRIKQP